MNIEQELANKKEKHKKKKNIVLDKFKYYSQEINRNRKYYSGRI